jgi:predicted permease
MLTTLWQDLTHGGRLLRKNPGFAFVAMASIAIGVGANAAMFSLADTLVLRPLTVPRASEIVSVSAVVPTSGFLSPTSSALSYPDYADVRDQARSFASLVAFRLIVAGFADRADQPAQRKFGMAVSGNLFDALGLQAAHGRGLTPEDDRVVGRDAVVVLDHELWQQQFASDPAIVGRRIRLGGVDMTVVGVMPQDFTGPDQFVQPSFYVPFAIMPALTSGSAVVELTKRDVYNIAVKGRLKPGVSLEQAAQEVSLIAANLSRAYPDTNRHRGLTVQTEFDARVQARPQLAVLAAMLVALSLIVLLVACANVAGLLASRAPVRAREMALRMAVGAGRLRVTRQLIVESLLIALSGGAAGLLLGWTIITFLPQIQVPTDVPLKLTMDLSDRVLVVGFVLATLSAIGSSLIPAWRASRTDLVSALKNQEAAEQRRQRLWGRNLLVSGQVGLSLVLLTTAVFLYRAHESEYGRGPGFRTDHLLLMSFQPDLAGYDAARAARFQDMLRERAAAVPGVRSVAFTSSVPFDSISIENTPIAPEGFQLPEGTPFVRVRSARVDAGYFDTLGIGITSGRAFRTGDTSGAPRVAVVNETFASRYWPGGVALGRRFRVTAPTGGASGTALGVEQPWIEIVGVAADARYRTVSEAPTPFIYYPLAQNPAPDSTIILHTEADPASFAAPLRAAVRSLDPSMPVFGVQTMEQFYRASALNVSDMITQTVGAMGLVGLLLSLGGLYGLVGYAVSRRTREIGIRMAVGAQARTVLRMVMRHGLVLAGFGTGFGLLASVASAGLLRAVFPFPNVPAVDVTTYVIVVPTLLGVTLLAAYFPARRAARIDPLIALRQE